MICTCVCQPNEKSHKFKYMVKILELLNNVFKLQSLVGEQRVYKAVVNSVGQ